MGKNRYNVGGDIIQLRDGKYYMYYCMCKGDSPLSALGVARADKVEGPYKNLGILLRSGAGKVRTEQIIMLRYILMQSIPHLLR